MEPTYRDIAEQMIGADNVTAELLDRLNRIQILCLRTDGRLRSRQVIAMVIEQYRRETDGNAAGRA